MLFSFFRNSKSLPAFFAFIRYSIFHGISVLPPFKNTQTISEETFIFILISDKGKVQGGFGAIQQRELLQIKNGNYSCVATIHDKKTAINDENRLHSFCEPGYGRYFLKFV